MVDIPSSKLKQYNQTEVIDAGKKIHEMNLLDEREGKSAMGGTNAEQFYGREEKSERHGIQSIIIRRERQPWPS